MINPALSGVLAENQKVVIQAYEMPKYPSHTLATGQSELKLMMDDV